MAVRSLQESLRIEGPLMVNRGVQLPPYTLDENGQRPPVDQAMVPEQFYGDPAGQAGVAYVPDPSDPYTSDGPVGVPGPVAPAASAEALGAGTVVVDGGPILATDF